MQKDKYLIILAGATASGKTSLSIQLAKSLQTVILSADSRQFYREMNIGTAKPTPSEQSSVKHYFVDSHSIHQALSLGAYEREALLLLEKLYQERDCLIMVGGSGMYIKAICEGLNEFPDVPQSIRQEVEKRWKKAGIEALQEELAQKDPEYYAKVDLQNPHRLIRALSVIRYSGQRFSTFHQRPIKERPFKIIRICLQLNREVLYQRINQRVHSMVKQGLVDEVKSLFKYRHLQALQTVGYQELFDHLEGKTNLQEAIELIQRNTRRYAKRQLTWFRKSPNWFYTNPQQYEALLQYLQSVMTQKLKIRKAVAKDWSKLQGFYRSQLIDLTEQKAAVWLIIEQNERIQAAIQLTTIKKMKVLSRFMALANLAEKSQRLLWQQAIHRSENQPLFAIVDNEQAHLIRSLNFHPLPLLEAPKQVRDLFRSTTDASLFELHQA
ncbi:MAG: tRNA (adenosine(37)-N6)-dimethylallyltransferase MiaA [Bacteroidota bacterium]